VLQDFTNQAADKVKDEIECLCGSKHRRDCRQFASPGDPYHPKERLRRTLWLSLLSGSCPPLATEWTCQRRMRQSEV